MNVRCLMHSATTKLLRYLETKRQFHLGFARRITQATLEVWEEGRLQKLITKSETSRSKHLDSLITWSIMLHCDVGKCVGIKDFITFYC